MSTRRWLRFFRVGLSKPSRGSENVQPIKGCWWVWPPAIERKTARHRCHPRDPHWGRRLGRVDPRLGVQSRKGGRGIRNQPGRTPAQRHRAWCSIWLGKGGCRFELWGLATCSCWGVHGHLGKTIHSVIPSRVVMNLRSAFSSEDGSYPGCIVGDDDKSTFDSELEQAWKDFLNGWF